MSKTTRNQSSRQLPAVSGSVRVLQPVGSVGKPEQQTGEVEINGKPYFIQVLETGYSLFGFDAKRRLTTHYQLPGDLASCECMDFLSRSDRREDRKCKHQKALAVLIARGKVPARPAPVCVCCHTDKEADALADEWADAEAEAWHAQFDAA
jgi:hypothetical protein